ncbi:hypothetical protein [Desulforamulus ferrireducens]|uniref:Uncharacterized protein n=1 Tax=Desulforamulus ferrireducens TaxID=1833852 RepID=A0A1S6IUT4_9FIRM|nr:hypothetical protein [Desulforamulus ferrireducens]AQS58531.1 hypothetical protein B0537_05175 [Desulforamulus ferrireducens]
MESAGFNSTILAQLLNIVVLLIFVVFVVLVFRALSAAPKLIKEVAELNRRLMDIEQILKSVEHKIDKKSS